MEFFKGVELPDVIVGLVGVMLDVMLLVSNLPGKFVVIGIVSLLFVVLIFPFDDEKGYMMVFSFLRHLTRPKQFTRKRGKETAVEDITPFTGIRDGYIEYGGAYYGKVVELSPIEFRFLTLSRQNAVIERMLGAVLRTVSADSTAMLVKIDRPVIYDDFLKAEERKMAEIKESFLNGLIDEAELKSRVAIIYDRMEVIKSYNTTDKVYQPFHYIVFFDKNKSILDDQAANAVSTMQSAGMDCHVLSGAETAVFLKYNYTVDFDEREIGGLTPDKYMDWILPKRIEIKARQVVYDGLITHNFRVTNYPMTVANAWGHTMFNIPGTRAVMKLKPVDGQKAVRAIDRAINELRGQEESTGRASKLIELNQHIDTLSSLLVMLQGDNETLFDTNIYITLYDYALSDHMALRASGKKNLPPFDTLAFKKRIRRMLSEQNFKTTDMLIQQFEAYASTQVSGYDACLGKARGIHSSTLAAVFPYVYTTLCDKGGFSVGETSGVPVFVNFFERSHSRVNSNMVIIGKSGSGKSYATKTLLSNLASEDSKVFILDPENEYQLLAKNLKGKIIDVGSATQGRLNPFHIITSISDDEDSATGTEDSAANTSFNMHLQFLEEFFKQILPGIDSDSLEYLNNLLIRLYGAKGIDGETDLSKLGAEDFPTFDDLYDKILIDYQVAIGEYSKENLRTLVNYISKFSTGGRNSGLWNGQSTLSTKENFIVFNFQSLLANKNNTLANAQMLLVLKWLDNEIIKNRDYNLKYGASRKIIIVIDEAHVFIDDKYPIALDFMYQLAKRIRKYNGMQIIITQNIKDFVGTEEIARKSTAIINACQYSFIFPLAPNDMHDLCKLYEKAGAINESEQEEIISNGRGRAFVVTSPNDRTSINIVATPEVREMFTME